MRNSQTYLSLDCGAAQAPEVMAGIREWLAVAGVEDAELSTEWTIWTPGENREDPPCPECGNSLPFDGELITQWWESQTEPTVDCSSCDHRGLLGDWESEWTIYGAHAAVTFEDRSELMSGVFERELMARLGGRPRKVYGHF